MKSIIRVLTLAALSVACAGVGAQDWPAKPVKFILSQAAGSPPDIIARTITERLGRALGQGFIVENRPGGQNLIGSQAAAKAAPDGYNFFFATTAALVTNIYTFKSLPYDPVRDFVPVATIGKSPFLVAVRPDVAAKNVAELIALAKAQPDTLAFASDGQRGFGGMLGDALKITAGIKVLHVPYTSSGAAIQDTVGGRTQYTIMGIPAVISLVKRGQLRPLAVSSAKRLPGLEDIPTLSETLPGFSYVGWFALVAPTGTPAEAIRRMNRALDKLLGDPEVAAKLRDMGIYTEGAGTPESTGEFIAAERAMWGKAIREIGIKPE